MKKLSKTLFWLGLGFGFGLAVRRLFLQDKPLPQLLGPHVLGWLDRDKSGQDLIEELDASGSRIRRKLMDTHPSRKNYKVLNHIIGIERWGQRRLAVALGERIVNDEYDTYRPPLGLSWNELQDQFVKTRQDTVDLAKQLEAAPAANDKIYHNSYGELTPAMWLTYLRHHAEGELLKMG